MADNARRRNILIALVIAIIVVILLLTRCLPRQAAAPVRNAATPPSTSSTQSSPGASGPSSAPASPEVLTPATLAVSVHVAAGVAFAVSWTGPDNEGDYITIVAREAPAGAAGNFRETKDGTPLELTAPMEPGAHEVRYVTGRSRTILARAPVEVEPIAATLDAAAEVMLGAPFSVRWTGPNNKGDYVTVVPKGAPEAHYASYAETVKGATLPLTAPTESGDFELRYVSGQGKKVLARRPIRVVLPQVTLFAPAEAIAGSTIEVAWTGPNNAGDYITLVTVETPEGEYGNYTDTSQGSPLKLLMPIMSGDAELRYMAGHNALARRSIRVVAAQVTLSAPAECAPGAVLSITWTGPNHPGDYITVVPKETPDGQYREYTETSKGSPLSVKAPGEPGDAEVRYMTGQGDKVLARFAIKVR